MADQPPAPAEDSDALKDDRRACGKSDAGAHHRHSHAVAVARLITPVAVGRAGDGGQKRRVPAPGHNGGCTAINAAAAVAVTLGLLPDEVLEVVFGFCDARTQMMVIPAVIPRWHGSACASAYAARPIDLAWAVRGYCCAITDAGVAGLALRFPGAATIVLGYSGNVTDGGLGAVAAGCPSLPHLSLEECERVTDGGIAAVAAGCPNLQHPNLYGCVGMTEATDGAVVARCPSLQHLDLSYCLTCD